MADTRFRVIHNSLVLCITFISQLLVQHYRHHGMLVSALVPQNLVCQVGSPKYSAYSMEVRNPNTRERGDCCSFPRLLPFWETSTAVSEKISWLTVPFIHRTLILPLKDDAASSSLLGNIGYLVSNGEQLHYEDQLGVGRNHTSSSFGTISIVTANGQFCLFS